MNRTVFRTVIALILSVYPSTGMASYAGITGISCATVEMERMCRCTEEKHVHPGCHCRHIRHEGSPGQGGAGSLERAHNSVKPAILARHCSCLDDRAPALPGLEGFDHLVSRLYHDVTLHEVCSRISYDLIHHSRTVEPPERPPPGPQHGRRHDSVGGVALLEWTIR